MNSLWEFMDQHGFSYISTILIAIIGLYLVFNILRLIEITLINMRMDNALVGFVVSLAKIVLYLLLLLICLHNLGIPLGGIVGALSAVTLAIGLAVQDIIGGVANGIMMVTSNLFKVNDFVEIGSVTGIVKEIKLLHTVIATTDNTTVTIPNKTVFSSSVKNYSSFDTRRVSGKFLIDYTSDIDRAKEILIDLATKSEYNLPSRKPAVWVTEVKQDGVQLYLNVWVKASDWWCASCYFNEAGFNALKNGGIKLAHPQVTVSYSETEGEEKHD